jgi:hypothetical protein
MRRGRKEAIPWGTGVESEQPGSPRWVCVVEVGVGSRGQPPLGAEMRRQEGTQVESGKLWAMCPGSQSHAPTWGRLLSCEKQTRYPSEPGWPTLRWWGLSALICFLLISSKMHPMGSKGRNGPGY